jgi:hypothetical protein
MSKLANEQIPNNSLSTVNFQLSIDKFFHRHFYDIHREES